jgi:hypothetical protein
MRQARVVGTVLTLGTVVGVPPVLAQQAELVSRPSVAMELSGWRLDIGSQTASWDPATLWGPTVRVALRPPVDVPSRPCRALGVPCSGQGRPDNVRRAARVQLHRPVMRHLGTAALFPIIHRLGLRLGGDILAPFGAGAGSDIHMRLSFAGTWAVN